MESARNPAPGLDLDQLAAQVAQLASSLQLIVVPATPVSHQGWGYLVLLDHNDLSAAEFCALAASAGARLLYVQTEDFTMRTDLDITVEGCEQSGPETSISAELADFRRHAESFNGRIRQLELAFAVECVLHCWAVVADWYVDFVDRAAELFPYPGSS